MRGSVRTRRRERARDQIKHGVIWEAKQWGNKDRETSNKQTMGVKECYNYKRMSKMSLWDLESGPERGTQR